MNKTIADIQIVCDVDGCGRLSAYRLTFDNGATYFICEKCYRELKNLFLKGKDKNETK